MTNKGIIERLQQDIVLGSEGYVFELEKRGFIKAGPYVPEVVLDNPDALRELSREFLQAGSEIIVALTYYANKNKLADVGRENDLEQINRQAVIIAKEIAFEGNALVAGNICNTWMYDPDNKVASKKIVKAMYTQQIQWAVDEGVDFIISETNDYLEEALIGLEVIKSFNLPAMVTLASVQTDSTRDGYDYVRACRILEENGADIVGLNCDRGPATMLPLVEKIRQNVDCFLAAQPVPYRTTNTFPTFESLQIEKERAFPLRLEPFLLNRFEMAEFAQKAKNIGVNYIGACCGNSPQYIRAMAEKLGRTVPASRYSPAIELHPMIGEKITKNNTKFLPDWRDE